MTLTARGKLTLVLLILLALIAVPGLAAYLYAGAIGLRGDSDPGRKVEVEIPRGASASAIGGRLEDAGVIRSRIGFRVALFIEGGDEDIQAGTYELRTGLTARDALDALLEGPVVEYIAVTFPEGSWLVDFARIVARDTHIARDDFLDVATSGEIRSRFQPDDVDTLEGLLFPSTYQVVEADDATSLVRRLVEEFDKRLSALDKGRLDRLGVSPYEAIIVASMVEAEARVPQDRGKIARVIYNRLDVGETLGIDATVLYALGEHKEVLTRSDLAVDSPYNTRLHPGLPPTPIGASGEESLKAAVDPPDGDWFFFVVADCSGGHAFSSTASEFARDKARYQELDC